MKIKIYGEPNEQWKPSQLPLIKKGLLELGHTLVDDPQNADALYCNDSHGYSQISFDTLRFNKPSLLTIHDIPEYQNDYLSIIENYKPYISAATAIAVNSYTTKNQIKRIFDVDSHVIFQPTKEITSFNYEKTDKKLRFLFVGRANSVNKRFYLVKELMEKYYSEKQLVVIGSENPQYGNYIGMISDNELNIYYNMSDYLLSPSSFEGLGLPPLEIILANKPPIVCNDCAASNELIPEFTCDPNVDSMYQKIQEIENNKKDYNWIIKQYAKKFYLLMDYTSVAENIVEVLEGL